MKNLFWAVLFSTLSFSNVWASKIHKAHVHGVAELSMAYEGKLISFNFEGSADGILGFEHAPKTDKQKKAVEELQGLWASKIQDFLLLTPFEDCKMKDGKLALEVDGKHAEVKAVGTMECEKPIKGRKAQLRFRSKFPHVETLNFKLLREDGTIINKKIKKKSEKFEL